MLNPEIFFSGDVTRSSPVLYHEYCIQDGNLVPKFSRVLLTLLLLVFTTHALLPIFPEESWALEWIPIRVEGQIRFENGYVWTWKFLNPERNSCGFKNIRIRVDGAWMNAWMACHPVSLCQVVFKHMAELHKEPIRLRYIDQFKVYKRYLRQSAAKKDGGSYFQRHCNELFSLTTKAPCFVSCVLCYNT